MSAGLDARALEQLARIARRLGETSEGAADSIEDLKTRVSTLWPRRQPLAYRLGADFNSTADQALEVHAARYVIRRIVVANPSISLTAAAGGIYTGASKGGTAIVAASQAYSALTGVSKFLDLTLAAICGTDWFVENPLLLSLTTPQGAPATADVFVWGDPLVEE